MRARPSAFLLLWALCACVAPTPRASEAPVAPRAAPEPAPCEAAHGILDAALASPDEKAEALGALGASGRFDALETLSAELEAEAGELRFAAAQGLVHLADPAAAKALIGAWGREKGWSVRKELARAVGASKVEALIPELVRATEDPAVHAEVKAAAAWALVDLGDPAGEAVLGRLGNPGRKGSLPEGADRWSRKVLRGEKAGEPALAIRTLGRMGVRDDAALIAGHLAAAEPELRIWAAAAVLRLACSPGNE